MQSLNEIDLSKLEKIGKTGNVYALNDEQILKVFTSEKSNSGKILNDLQGLPFVPKIYEYGEDWLIMQRIKGNILWFHQKGFSWFNVKLNYKEHKKNTLDFIDGSIAKGWMPEGLHQFNVMMGEDGKLYVCDVGRFIKIDGETVSTKNEYQKLLLGYCRGINQAYDTIESRIELLGKEKMLEICTP
ncbi:hypothetical protein [Sutcliffiella horikoshii]|uniref:hypothetical protein n=1 Tax=Sutcliffiella horikoshii TaxID=79883 RepID=UPI00384E2497